MPKTVKNKTRGSMPRGGDKFPYEKKMLQLKNEENGDTTYFISGGENHNQKKRGAKKLIKETRDYGM